MQLNPRQHRLSTFTLLEKSNSFVHIALEGKILKGGQGEKGEHVAAREGSDKGLFRIRNFGRAEIFCSGGGSERNPVSKIKRVISRIALVSEVLVVAVPSKGNRVGAHVQ
jgi:hypothetical protein